MLQTSGGFEVGWRVDRGRRRRRNEDSVLVCLPAERWQQNLPVWLFAVADGMGGGPAGELASKVAVAALEAGFEADLRYEPVSALSRLFEKANSDIARLAQTEHSYKGMGSTLVAALVTGNSLWVANVGDSRAYLIREGVIRQLTEDHSWVAEQVKAGHMSEGEATRSPHRSVITRSLGISETVQIDTFAFGELLQGDTLLLCSDGLYAVLNDMEIASFATGLPAQQATDELVAVANSRGGPDNITVVIARRA